MLYLGTSGYYYKDWIGYFYPNGTKPDKYLDFYKDYFNSCEINATYYRMPTPKMLESMVERSLGKICFSLKLPKEITHDKANISQYCSTFKSAIVPLLESETLGAILAQFPYSFANQQVNRAYLCKLKESFSNLPLVVELRNSTWINNAVKEFLIKNEIGFCCVDEPKIKGLIPKLDWITSDIAYVRFHGRNSEQWYNNNQAWERYDYEYSDEELSEWIESIRKMIKTAKKTFIYANNHYKAKAVTAINSIANMINNTSNNQNI